MLWMMRAITDLALCEWPYSGSQVCPAVGRFKQCKVCDGEVCHGGPKQEVPASSQQRATRLPPPYELPDLEGDVADEVAALWDFLEAKGCAPIANYEEEQRPDGPGEAAGPGQRTGPPTPAWAAAEAADTPTLKDGVESAAAPSQVHAAPAQPWAPTSPPPLPQSSPQPATVQPRASRASASTEGGGGATSRALSPPQEMPDLEGEVDHLGIVWRRGPRPPGQDTADSEQKREACTQRCTVQNLEGGMCEGRCAREAGHVDRGENRSFDGGHFCFACWDKGLTDPPPPAQPKAARGASGTSRQPVTADTPTLKDGVESAAAPSKEQGAPAQLWTQGVPPLPPYSPRSAPGQPWAPPCEMPRWRCTGICGGQLVPIPLPRCPWCGRDRPPPPPLPLPDDPPPPPPLPDPPPPLPPPVQLPQQQHAPAQQRAPAEPSPPTSGQTSATCTSEEPVPAPPRAPPLSPSLPRRSLTSGAASSSSSGSGPLHGDIQHCTECLREFRVIGVHKARQCLACLRPICTDDLLECKAPGCFGRYCNRCIRHGYHALIVNPPRRGWRGWSWQSETSVHPVLADRPAG